MPKSSLYIGGGLREPLIISLLPIIDGICKKKKINKLIFETSLSNKSKNLKIFRNIKNEYDVKFLNEIINQQNKLLTFIKKITIFTIIFIISFFCNRKSLIFFKKKWIFLQILNSIWEGGIALNKLSFNELELRSRIIICHQITNKIIDYLYLKNNINFAVFGHTVYLERAIFALLRNFGLKIILYKNGILSFLKNKNDLHYNNLEKKIFFKSLKIIPKKKIDKYWVNFLRGNSKYHGAKTASRIISKKKIQSSSIENVIMLHVFRDAPNIDIDRSKIFTDFYEWIKETLNILKKSDEMWIIRKHPLSKRWGENQTKIINKIFREVFNNKIPKNIKFEKDLRSNLKQFKSAKRIVTFSGNSHLEATCIGKKPIIISHATLSDYGKDFFYKPNNIKEYKNLLLKGDEKKFTLQKNKIQISKRVLFLLQNVINTLDDTGVFHVLRNDKKNKFELLFKRTSFRTTKNYKKLFKIGYNLGSVYNQSINTKYFNIF